MVGEGRRPLTPQPEVSFPTIATNSAGPKGLAVDRYEGPTIL